MRSYLRVILSVIIWVSASPAVYAQGTQRTSRTVRQEQDALTRQMRQTQTDIEFNRKLTRNQLNQLNSLNSVIEVTTANIAIISNTIIQLNTEERRLTDSINTLDIQVEVLKKECTKALRDQRKRRQSLSALTLVFSADNFLQAMKRLSYIKQINKAATQRQRTLIASQRRLSSHRNAMVKVKEKQTMMYLAMERENESLKEKQTETQAIISQLQSEASALASVLDEQQRKARALDAELDRIIAQEARIAEERRRAEQARIAQERRRAEEARRAEQERQAQEKRLAEQTKRAEDSKKPSSTPAVTPAPSNAPSTAGNAPSTAPSTTPTTPQQQKSLAGTFEQDKGNLLFPVSGQYNIVSKFGVNAHKNLPGVKTENSGIDIKAKSGSNARAAYDGVVSSVFYLDGYHNIVMVRHGEYLTVYANIESLAVHKGDTVKRGQQLGKIFSDPADNNRTVLHFEIRHETQKLNPLDWVKR